MMEGKGEGVNVFMCAAFVVYISSLLQTLYYVQPLYTPLLQTLYYWVANNIVLKNE